MFVNFKFWVVRNALSQSDFEILKSAISQQGNKHDFLHADIDWQKIKVVFGNTVTITVTVENCGMH